MSRFRSEEEDLAYGDIPQRWDRDRFERFSSRPPPATRYEEDFRFTERDRPGRRDIAVAERSRSRGPRGRFEERERFVEEDRHASRPRRRTDKELFGDVDPRELAGMALEPYRRKSITREELDIDQRESPRPGLLRRQSSLDTFDRRSARYEKDEYRMQPYTPVPLPIRRRRDEFEESRYEPEEDYREVEIQRERSVHRRRPAKSEAGRSVKEEVKSVSRHQSNSSSSSSTTVEEVEKEETVRGGGSSRAASTKARSSRAPSVHESIHESSFNESVSGKSGHESIHESSFEESVRQERKFKKGKTRMPKRLVRREAIMDLGYPFDEEESFFMLRIALDKEQIDEVIKISETYRDGEKKKVYRFEAKIDESDDVSIPAPPIGQETITRTEWINPPSVIGGRSKSVRASSPSAKSSISRRLSPGRSEHRHRSQSRSSFVEERRTVIEETRSPPPPPLAPAQPSEFYEDRRTFVEERIPDRARHKDAIVLAEREHRSDRDLHAEIRALEAERRALRFEREGEEQHDLARRLREHDSEDTQIVEYRNRPMEVVGVYERERERSPPRNVVRVEKDRKGRMALVRSAH